MWPLGVWLSIASGISHVNEPPSSVAKGACKHPEVARTAPATKNDRAQNVSSAEAENPVVTACNDDGPCGQFLCPGDPFTWKPTYFVMVESLKFRHRHHKERNRAFM